MSYSHGFERAMSRGMAWRTVSVRRALLSNCQGAIRTLTGERRYPRSALERGYVTRCASSRKDQPQGVRERALSSSSGESSSDKRGLEGLKHLVEESRSAAVKAVTFDAAGTLISPSETVMAVYARYAKRHGLTVSQKDILRRYRAAYQRPWPRPLRFNGDARDFWQVIVTEAIGSDDPAIFEDIYRYYEKSEAWMVAPGAPEAIQRLKDAGLKLAVVSNFDTRLGKILETVGLANYFDTVVCSAEVEAEKPSPLIFQEALRRLGCEPEEVIHIGDDRRNDLWGARGAGIACLLYGTDARTFNDVADHILSGRPPGDRNLN